MAPRDLIDDLRSRINPAYAEQVGTESWERRLCAEALEAQADEIERLGAEIEAMRKQVAPSAPDEWQPIETAPQTGEQFMVRREHTPYPIMARHNPEYNWIEDLNGDHLYSLTGWHTLPPIDAQAAPSVPEGWKSVPVEPTLEMLEAAQTAWLKDPCRKSSTIYRAMVAAAPGAQENNDA